MTIEFHGAAKTVTGSKHLVTLENGSRILLDCGMFQGHGKTAATKNNHFGFNPETIDAVVLSHAHIDHSGLIPRLVKHGFKGNVYCTPATYDLCKIMLLDSAFIQENDARFLNKKRKGKKSIKPLYTIEDVGVAMASFVPIPYNTARQIRKDVRLTFTDAGHLLGSAICNLELKEENKTIKLAFTGDVGRYTNKILKPPQSIEYQDIVICEGTYGNRLHENETDAIENLRSIIHETCVVNGGKLIIPAFSVGKTQELIFALNKLEFEGHLPKIDVFVDSPLAVNATEILKNHSACFGTYMKKFKLKDPDPFGFDQLHYIKSVEASKSINTTKEPCIIISAAGMMNAGRVKHHLLNNLGNDRNAVLIVGYCEPSTLGGKLMRGDKEVSIFKQAVQIRARIYQLDYYSAHADRNELLQFLSPLQSQPPNHLFLVHGNEESLEEFSQDLVNSGIKNVHIPEEGSKYTY